MKINKDIIFVSNAHIEEISIVLDFNIPLSALEKYLRQMPTISSRVDECVIKIQNICNKQLLREEEYSNSEP